MTNQDQSPGSDRTSFPTELHDPAQSGTPGTDQRARNLRTGLTLAAVAAGFFIAVIVRHVILG